MKSMKNMFYAALFAVLTVPAAAGSRPFCFRSSGEGFIEGLIVRRPDEVLNGGTSCSPSTWLHRALFSLVQTHRVTRWPMGTLFCALTSRCVVIPWQYAAYKI